MDGFLVIDKPLKISSREAVDRVQAWLPPGTRVGHTGTLDPLASGVLVLALGRATRLTDYVHRQTKVYQAGVRLGTFSTTDDAEGDLTVVADAARPEPQALRRELDRFLGETSQVPPAYSAAHVRGQRAYRLARKGKPVALEPRLIRIDRLDVLAYDYPQVELEIECGKGTYIRSVARDLGQRLGCGGYLSALRRTRVGPFRAESALALTEAPPALESCLRPLVEAFPQGTRIVLDKQALHRLELGQAISVDMTIDEPEVAVLDECGELAAVARWDVAERRLHPIKVFSRRD